MAGTTTENKMRTSHLKRTFPSNIPVSALQLHPTAVFTTAP